jgi:preprotein translocase subunit SecF
MAQLEFFKQKTKIRFMATRKWWYALSGVFIAASLIALWKPGLNYGIDFTGGVAIELGFPAAANLDKVRAAVAQAGFAEAQVQNFGTSRDVIVRLEPQADVSGTQIGERITQAAQSVDKGAQLRRVDVVGPQVGEELREKGYTATLFTFIFILFYIWARFQWKLGVGAILAAMHTPIVILGFFAATQMTFDLTVLAAVLAVVGYQINDTVVVFDRARERFPLMRNAKPAEVLDAAINETLSRTVITSVATMIVVAALLVLGGETLRGFSAAILIGVVVGTYSSIYIASASALDMGLTAANLMAVREKRAPLDDLP